jgi:hypothetical protein
MAKGYKTGGRTAGTPNKATTEFRQTITSLLEKNAAKVDLWLQQVADGYGDVRPDPAKALDLLAKLAEFGAPKLSRSELSGPDGGPIEVLAKEQRDAAVNAALRADA